jgi:NADH:ubiquinone oxidoreductase subunit F (NADH-binding)
VAAMPLATVPPRTDRLSSHFAHSGDWMTLEQHRTRFEPTPPVRRKPDESLMEEVERAGLHGRGGAGFPTSVKLHAVAQPGRRPIVLVNGSEGEPTSVKDATLMSLAPHLVLDGAMIAAAAVGADEIVIGVKLGPGAARAAIDRAVDERYRTEPWSPHVRVIDVPPTYLAGEERALVNLVDRGHAIPPPGRSRPFERGIRNRPTLVQNVETLAHLALIRQMGAEWFRRVGHPDQPGTMLVTVAGSLRAPGVYEVPTGQRLVELLRIAGGATQEIGAILVGGYSGTWVSGGSIERASLDRAGMAEVGGVVGCASIVALPSSFCGIHETAAVMRWLANQTAGQCGPCVRGLDSIAGTIEDVWRGRAQGEPLSRLTRWAGLVEGRGACRYPDGAVRFLRSALETFRNDADAHARGHPCAGAQTSRVLPLPDVGDRR